MGIGALLLVWGFWTWRWSDPVTSLYTAWQQRQLADAYEERLSLAHDRAGLVVPEKDEAAAPDATAAVPRPATSAVLERLRRDAMAYRRTLVAGDPIARLRVPALDLNTIVVEGTDGRDLRQGPGRHSKTFVPGEGELTYIAGHRTTFGAPFAHIDRLRPGDRAVVELPYGTLIYRVGSHRIVSATELSVLRSRGIEQVALQACHPRFFATQRYIVYATLELAQLAFRGKLVTYRMKS